uniref:Uncharacterized protein n=1 Tax=Rhizochromulina marina TaxID=1034831 RepID=A0A7S2WVI9_9STRA
MERTELQMQVRSPRSDQKANSVAAHHAAASPGPSNPLCPSPPLAPSASADSCAPSPDLELQQSQPSTPSARHPPLSPEGSLPPSLPCPGMSQSRPHLLPVREPTQTARTTMESTASTSSSFDLAGEDEGTMSRAPGLLNRDGCRTSRRKKRKRKRRRWGTFQSILDDEGGQTTDDEEEEQQRGQCASCCSGDGGSDGASSSGHETRTEADGSSSPRQR